MAAIGNNAAGRKRILLLATGGTIACAAGADGLTPGLTGEQLAEFVPELADLADIDVRQVMNIDSSNMQPTDWLTLVAAIRDVYATYDGFVVLHGTDTMAYTAAALSCLIEGLAKPVVLTGSQLPMTDSQTDARHNLFDAACVACDNSARGVMVVFAGRVIDGLRARKARTRSFDAFESVNAPDLGKVAGGEVVWASERVACGFDGPAGFQSTACSVVGFSDSDSAVVPVSASGNQPAAREKPASRGGAFAHVGAAEPFGSDSISGGEPAAPATSTFRTQLNPRVQVLKITPTTNAAIIEAMRPLCDALVVEAYGLGGVPQSQGVTDALLAWADSGKLLVLTTQCPYEDCDPSVYEVGRAFANHPGVIIAGNLTTEAALAKTMCELAR